MGQAIPSQHPAVVLRSHYTHLRVLLAILLVAVVGLTVAVVVLAGNEGAGSIVPAARSDTPPGLRMPSHVSRHGGAPVPDLRSAPLPNGRRYDGGPEEGTRGIVSAQPPNTRRDGGPEEGTRGPGH